MAKARSGSSIEDLEPEYYCAYCGAGKREYMECELPVCNLVPVKRKRQRNAKDKAPS